MKIGKRKQELNVLDAEIKKLIDGLSEVEADSEEYEAKLYQIEKLNEVREALTKSNGMSLDRLDINTVLSATVGLASILLILNYEKADVITSKAFNLGSKMIGR